MKKFGTLAVALVAAAMLSSTPSFAKDMTIKAPEIPQAPTISEPQAPKVELSESLGSKGKEAVDSAQKRIDNDAEKLKDQLSETQKLRENLDVTQESVTVETPSGVAQETETVITPETPAK